jgi:hypothetical protein
MSPRKQPARLWLRPARGKRASAWIIIDNRRQHSTGCSASEHERAERALEAYIAKKRIEAALPRFAPAEKVFIADVLRNYVSAKGGDVSRGEELAGRIERLLDWWGDKTLASVTRVNCEAYARSRSTTGAARRELEDMRAAINLAISEGVCRDAVKVKLPKKQKARSRFLTRGETAKLLWSAWSFREVQKGVPTDKRPTRSPMDIITLIIRRASEMRSRLVVREGPRRNRLD